VAALNQRALLPAQALVPDLRRAPDAADGTSRPSARSPRHRRGAPAFPRLGQSVGPLPPRGARGRTRSVTISA
jgi:hypothetical protein